MTLKGDHMREGTVFFNADLDRMDIKFEDSSLGGFHCGDSFQIYLHCVWEDARIEYDHKRKEWYLIYGGTENKILDIPMVGLLARC